MESTQRVSIRSNRRTIVQLPSMAHQRIIRLTTAMQLTRIFVPLVRNWLPILSSYMGTLMMTSVSAIPNLLRIIFRSTMYSIRMLLEQSRRYRTKSQRASIEFRYHCLKQLLQPLLLSSLSASIWPSWFQVSLVSF